MQALMLLYWMQCCATWRKLFRSCKTVKGAIATAFFLGCVSMMVLPLAMATVKPDSVPSVDGQRYLLLMMFAYFIYSMLTSVSDRVLYFAPAEVDHLFPAPFHRKELLVYKIFSWFTTSVFMGMILTCVLGVHMNKLHYGYFGVVATLFAITMSDMFISVLGQFLATKLFSKARKIVALVCLLMVATGVSQTLLQSSVLGETDFHTVVDKVDASPTAQLVLAPFAVFSNLIYADSLSAFAGWLGAALAIVGALIASIFTIDANYLEAADQVSKKRFEKAARMQAGRSMVSDKANRWCLNMFPFWNGFGPIAWRQLTETIRRSQMFLFVGLLIAIGFSVPLLLRFKSDVLESPAIVVWAYGAITYLMFIMSMNVPSGFRADVDHIEVFKSLPLPAFSVAAGELFGGVLMFLSLFFFVGCCGALATQDFFDMWLGGFLLAVPIVIYHMSLVNILFLHFPVRYKTGSKGVEQVGQVFLSMMLLGLVYFGVAIVLGVPVSVVYWLTQSIHLAGLVMIVGLSLLAIAALFLLGKTYQGFDVAKIPG